MKYQWVLMLLAGFLILCMILGCRVHIKSWIDNLTFDYRYFKGNKKHNMSRLTERAYIKGLNEGYALAKAQYENRRATLYNLPDTCTCGECRFTTNKKNSEMPIPNFCIKCGCRFDTIQNTPYPLEGDFK